MMHGTRMFSPATARPFRGADLSGSHTRAMRVIWHPDPERQTILMMGIGRDAIGSLGLAKAGRYAGRAKISD